MNIIPVILAGGVGERFWPLSRRGRPKQVLAIISKRPMIEETIIRARTVCGKDVRPLIVTGRAMAPHILRCLPKNLRCDNIIEPAGKNTAPAIAAAAAVIRKKFGDALMLVLPADHAVSTTAQFASAVRQAAAIAAGDRLCVFGIRPSRPDTGYGYIQAGEKFQAGGTLPSFIVRRFVEKPAAAVARKYCASGYYYWNSGMFLWKASVILEEIAAHMPDLHQHVAALTARPITAARLDAFYRRCPAQSIDFGVMEKSARVIMVCPEFRWDDVGSWEALERIHGRNEHATTHVGERIFDGGCAGSIVVNTSKLTVAACGLKDTVVAATDDAVLVVSRDKIPLMKQYLAAMKSAKGLPRQIF